MVSESGPDRRAAPNPTQRMGKTCPMQEQMLAMQKQMVKMQQQLMQKPRREAEEHTVSGRPLHWPRYSSSPVQRLL
eukprot:3941865-Rhodomonas_salina.1